MNQGNNTAVNTEEKIGTAGVINEEKPVVTPEPPTPPVQTSKKVEVSEDLLRDLMSKVQGIEGMQAVLDKVQKENADLKTQMDSLPKNDEWYEEQKRLFADGRNSKKTVRLLLYKNNYFVGFKNLTEGQGIETYDKMVPNPLNPEQTLNYRVAILLDTSNPSPEPRYMTEEVLFPKFLEQCQEEVVEVAKEILKEETLDEGETIVREYDEKKGILKPTGETRRLFVKVQKRHYVVNTSKKGELTMSERWINQK